MRKEFLGLCTFFALFALSSFWIHPSFTEDFLKIEDPSLHVEALAYDGKEGNFYLGVINQRKILKVDKKGEITEFKGQAEDGLMAVTALGIDEKSRVLWVCTTGLPEMENAQPGELGKAMIYKYSLASGNLLRKYDSPEDTLSHYFNDLAVSEVGTVFFSDKLAKAVYVIQPGSLRKIELFVQAPEFEAPSGVALSGSAKELYITDEVAGLYMVSFTNNLLKKLENTTETAYGNLEKLFVNGSNVYGLSRKDGVLSIAAFSTKKDQIKDIKWLPEDVSTLESPGQSCWVGSSLYLVNRSRWADYSNGKLSESIAPGKETTITRLKL